MNYFPDVSPPHQNHYEESVYKPVLRSEMESNYIITRPRATRSRRHFTLGWEALTENEYNAIKEFYDNNTGNYFYWTHPLYDEDIRVVFGIDQLPPRKRNGFLNGQRAWAMTGLVLWEV